MRPIEAGTKKKSEDKWTKDPEANADCAEREPNLDSGYAWLILAVMFLLSSTIYGTSRVYGLIFARQISTGYYNHEQASWPIATASTVENLAGILTPALAQFLSWRQIQLLSTSLFIASNLGAYFSDSLLIDILCLGVIQGVALSSSTVLTLAINNDYFERYRTTAYGISMSGATCGVFILCPLVQRILDSDPIHFRPVYLAIAACLMLNLALSLFIIPRADTRAAREQLERKQNEKEKKKKGLSTSDDTKARRMSRFEAHFERKNSIASINIDTKSRRQSALGRKISILSRGADSPSTCSSNPINRKNEHDYDHSWLNSSHLKQADPVKRYILSKINRSTQSCKLPSAQRINGIRSYLKCSDSNNKRLQSSKEVSCNNNGSCGKISTHSLDFNKLIVSIRKCSKNEPEAVIETATAAVATENGGLSNFCCPQRQQSLDNGAPTTNCQANKTAQTSDTFRAQQAGEFQGLKKETSVVVMLRKESGSVESDPKEALEQSSREKCNSSCKIEKNERQQFRDNDDDDENVEEQQTVYGLLESIKFLGQPYIHCVWIMLTIYYLVSRTFIIILADFGEDHGLSSVQSYELLNYWAIGELLGRVLLASLIDLRWISVKSCITCTCASLAACITLMASIENFYIYIFCSTSIAALISLEYMLINALMVEYLGKSKAIGCYSIAAAICSLLLFARPTLIGLFRDHYGSYDGLLLLLALICLTFACLFAILEPLFVRKWPKFNDPKC